MPIIFNSIRSHNPLIFTLLYSLQPLIPDLPPFQLKIMIYHYNHSLAPPSSVNLNLIMANPLPSSMLPPMLLNTSCAHTTMPISL